MYRSLLKASPEGEGFHPSQTGTLRFSLDIVEVDVRKSADDVLYCLHGGLLENVLSQDLCQGDLLT